jgi:hypothetical protein
MSEENAVLEEVDVASADVPKTDQPGDEPKVEPVSEEPKEEEKKEEPRQKPNRMQKRFDTLTREIYTLRNTVRELSQRQGAQPEEVAPVTQQYQSQPDPMAEAEFFGKLERAKLEYPDFEKVIDSSKIPIPAEIGNLIKSSDLSGDLMYHFAKNPQDLIDLHYMNGMEAAREIGRIESSIELSKGSKQVVSKKPSNAPAPIKPLAGNDKVNVDPEKMTIGEWMQWRKEQQLKKR